MLSEKDGEKAMDMTAINPLRDELMKKNQAFRELVQQHESYEKRLAELANLSYPKEDELVEESSLKKKKLAIKDEIYTMLQDHSKDFSH